MIDPKKALDNLVQAHIAFTVQRAKPIDPWHEPSRNNSANKDMNNAKNTSGAAALSTGKQI